MSDFSVSVVMAYYERRPQLLKTLESFEQYAELDYEIIVVDDGSLDSLKRSELPASLPVEVIRLDGDHTNPCVPFNLGFQRAQGDTVVIQNPECYHVGDVLGDAMRRVTETNYVVYSCLSLSESMTTKFWTDIPVKKIIKRAPKRQARISGEYAWYVHPEYRKAHYHFLSAIKRTQLTRIGGFDEDYSYGICYDDDDLVKRVGAAGLSMEIIEDPMCFHQWHPRFNYDKEDSASLVARNRELFMEKWLA